MNVTLNWTANTESDLLRYKVYHGPAAGVYDTNFTVDAPAVTTTINGLADGRLRYFAVAAVDNALGEGTKSSEVSIINKHVRGWQ